MKKIYLVQHKLCENKWILHESVCNSKQKQNHNECCVSVKNQIIEVSVKMIIYEIVELMLVNALEYVKLMNIQILQISLGKTW